MVRLTEELLQSRGVRSGALDKIKNLNVWGLDLDDVSLLRSMTQLEVVSAVHNNIVHLEDFKYCSNLRELFLRKNNVSDFAELNNLVNIKNLRTLFLSENPIAESPQYRLRVISMLPQLKALDTKDITEEERLSAKALLIEKRTSDSLIPIGSTSNEKFQGDDAQPRRTTSRNVLLAINILLQDLDISGLEACERSVRQMLDQARVRVVKG
mmetsp:Transcript_24618/g.40535  ORF Transcript_24618/g.40535 Transcript_24618/m.40535 type:complete len:211 (-) Transcript_24618:1-633(-)